MKSRRNGREESLSVVRKSKQTGRSFKKQKLSPPYKFSRVEENKNMKRMKGDYDETKHRQRDYYGFKTNDRSLGQDSRLSDGSRVEVNRISGGISRRKDSASVERVRRSRSDDNKSRKTKKYRSSSQDTSSMRESSLNSRSRSKKDSDSRRVSRNREEAYKQISEMISIEKHHTRFISGHFISGDVRWCPRYINPDIKGHARGGTSLLHHRCRGCRRICFHLLGRPGTTRLCLACSGYKERYIPDWYYHRGCKYCM